MHTSGKNDKAWAEAMARVDEHEARPEFAQRESMERLRAELHAELEVQQLKTFTRWWNSWLFQCSPPLRLTDLCLDVPPGVYPIRLLEVLSDSKAPKFNTAPKSRYQSIENQNTFLAQLKAASVRLVNIGAEDLVSGNRKLILGLTWTLILRCAAQGSNLWGEQ